MSLDLNICILSGRLVDNPKEMSSGSGCMFSMASNRKYRDKDGEVQEETTFMTVKCWGRLGDLVMKNCRKGDTVISEGRLSTRKVDTDNGKRTYTDIVARDVRFDTYRDAPDEATPVPASDVAPEHRALIKDLIG